MSNIKHTACSVKGCDSVHSCKSYCNRHYIQVRKYGRVQTKADMAVRYARRPRVIHPNKNKKVSWAKSHIDAIKKANTGRRAWNYNGGSGTKRHQAMGQIAYKQWREAVFARDNYTCQDCEETKTYLHADHIIGWAEDESLRYNITNGKTLCYLCHYKKTFGKLNVDKALLWGVPRKHRGTF